MGVWGACADGGGEERGTGAAAPSDERGESAAAALTAAHSSGRWRGVTRAAGTDIGATAAGLLSLGTARAGGGEKWQRHSLPCVVAVLCCESRTRRQEGREAAASPRSGDAEQAMRYRAVVAAA